ncbi:hypothetical protein TIFTF001_040184 [Ficus carica]|uniref:Uncharacterized protein n=1 Tax=Ficus carica TaxID=3494 RepID=A0AA87ZCF4_FICCA|nr:hypothetical protein TIFTF001_040184 [Ficus carica]
MSCSPKLGHGVLLPCGDRPWCLGVQALACQGTRLGGWFIQARNMRCLTLMVAGHNVPNRTNFAS